VMSVYFPLKGEAERNAISYLNLQPRTAEDHSAALEEVKKIIGRNHGFDYRDPDAFDVMDSVAQAEAMGAVFDAMDLFLGTVGAVTLVLGAIGVVNVMLIAVSERTKEIGLRKALGATNRSILMQFFLEGVLLTLLSGAVGIVFAGGLMVALGSVQGPGGFDPPRLVPMTATLAVGCLTVAGLIAGLYPARKAALLQPVEAMRQE
jgi:putative ABC transport system permease protein